MAGYFIYSLDWDRFRTLVERPTPAQLSILAQGLAEVRDNLDGEFDEGDPVLSWPSEPEGLVPLIAERLARTDWYNDLSDQGRDLWEATLFEAVMDHEGLDVDFRVDSDGVYWHVIDLIIKQLGDPPERPGKSAMSRFGTVPFRYQPPAEWRPLDWSPMHSMHPPDEVRRMLSELRSVAQAVESSPDADVRREFTDELLPAVEQVANDGRLLFIQVDT